MVDSYTVKINVDINIMSFAVTKKQVIKKNLPPKPPLAPPKKIAPPQKTVILVFTQNFKNITINKAETRDNQYSIATTYFGLGDIIRGIYGMLNFCAAQKYKLIVDISLHPISRFLKPVSHPFAHLVQANKDKIDFILAPGINKYLVDIFHKSDIALVCTNMNEGIAYKKLQESSRQFVRNLLIPNDELSAVINTYKSKLPKKFEAIHYRLGDQGFLQNLDAIEKWYDHFMKNYKSGQVVFTDCVELKKIIKSRHPDICTFDHEIGHIGYEIDDEKIRNTLVEFFLMSSATQIHSFTVFHWVSGFVNSIHHTFNVPLKGYVKIRI